MATRSNHKAKQDANLKVASAFTDAKPQAAAETKVETKPVSIFVKLFVAWQITVMIIWTLPNPRPEVLSGRLPANGSDQILLFNNKNLKTIPPVSGYLMATGTWQFWDMFAPDPAQTDFWGDAIVTYRDGTTSRYLYPRMYELDVFKKYLMERYRKFYERAHTEDYAFLWPIFGQRIAEKCYTDRKNPPVKVALSRHWQAVQRPSQKDPNPPYYSYQYFTHVVDLTELESAKDGK